VSAGQGPAAEVPGRVSGGQAPAGQGPAGAIPASRREHGARAVTAPTTHESTADDTRIDTAPLLDGLRRDPSIRYTEPGRYLVRWLSARVVPASQCQDVIP